MPSIQQVELPPIETEIFKSEKLISTNSNKIPNKNHILNNKKQIGKLDNNKQESYYIDNVNKNIDLKEMNKQTKNNVRR